MASDVKTSLPSWIIECMQAGSWSYGEQTGTFVTEDKKLKYLQKDGKETVEYLNIVNNGLQNDDVFCFHHAENVDQYVSFAAVRSLLERMKQKKLNPVRKKKYFEQKDS